MIIKVLTPVFIMAALGISFGCILAFALKIFNVKVDENIVKILSLLPGVNCGACGKPGCSAFAEALASGEVMPSGCAVNSDENRHSIAKLIGLEHEEKVKTSATFLCNGGVKAKDKFLYEGIRSCRASTLLFGGHKECAFGCLGLGDCAEVCPVDAIHIDRDGLPVVDEKLCVSCGKCVEACPKSLFKILPVDKVYYVKCSSHDTGAVTMKVCKSGCIGCFKCEKACPESAIKVESNLSRIDIDKCKNIGKCAEACPTKVIFRRF